MELSRLLLQPIRSSDAGINRLLRYWAIGLALYGVSLPMLWFEAWMGVAPRQEVLWLSTASIAGVGLVYVAIRASGRFGLRHSLLNTIQRLYAIVCIIAAYALVGPMRGVTLSILVVVVVFGSFSSTPGQMRATCLFAITLLCLTMLWKSQTDAARYPPHEELVHFVLAATMLVAVTYMADLLSGLRGKLKARTQALTNALARIQDLAMWDELTRLVNRRQMTDMLEQDSARRKRSGETACIAILDIDHFKRVNDRLGHAAGDEVLVSFANQAVRGIRLGDVLARWGGEEFLLLLPATRLDGAKVVLDRMLALVRESVRIGADPSLRITVSAGVAETSAGQSVDATIELADKALYRAKRAGRDRIACAPTPRIPEGGNVALRVAE